MTDIHKGKHIDIYIYTYKHTTSYTKPYIDTLYYKRLNYLLIRR